MNAGRVAVCISIKRRMQSSEHELDRTEEGPDLPGLRTWRGVYWLVVGSFVLWLGILLALSALFA